MHVDVAIHAQDNLAGRKLGCFGLLASSLACRFKREVDPEHNNVGFVEVVDLFPWCPAHNLQT